MAVKIFLWFMTLLPLFCFLGWILLTEKQSPEDLVRIRQSLYTNTTEQISDFSKPPDQWQESELPHDSPELIAKYKEITIGIVPDILNAEVLAKISNLESKVEQAEVFLAFASFAGLTAREVHSTTHTTVEIFEPSTSRWVWLDPQFAIIALDEKNKLPRTNIAQQG